MLNQDVHPLIKIKYLAISGMCDRHSSKVDIQQSLLVVSTANDYSMSSYHDDAMNDLIKGKTPPKLILVYDFRYDNATFSAIFIVSIDTLIVGQDVGAVQRQLISTERSA